MVEARLTVQTVWFWTVRVEGIKAKVIQAFLGLSPEFALDPTDPSDLASQSRHGLHPLPGKDLLRHNARAGFYVKAIEPQNTFLGAQAGEVRLLGISTTDPRLRFGPPPRLRYPMRGGVGP